MMIFIVSIVLILLEEKTNLNRRKAYLKIKVVLLRLNSILEFNKGFFVLLRLNNILQFNNILDKTPSIIYVGLESLTKRIDIF